VPLKTYLRDRFVDKQAFCALAGISPRRLEAFIRASAVPGPSYVCTGRSLWSAAFGQIGIDEYVTGEYFRPECGRWAAMAAQAAPGEERATTLAVLASELRGALQQHFQDQAVIDARVLEFIPSFTDGTFGVCVADPGTGHGIVRKELLQERLVAVTDDGRNPFPKAMPRGDLLRIIDDYAAASMPFSPPEYPRSSRKRLVDDLRMALAHGPCEVSP
jgi:hypothetical protein